MLQPKQLIKQNNSANFNIYAIHINNNAELILNMSNINSSSYSLDLDIYLTWVNSTHRVMSKDMIVFSFPRLRFPCWIVIQHRIILSKTLQLDNSFNEISTYIHKIVLFKEKELFGNIEQFKNVNITIYWYFLCLFSKR